MYILFFSGVNNIPDGFSDNWKEAKFKTGFFSLTETISFHFFFLAVPQTLSRLHWKIYKTESKLFDSGLNGVIPSKF